jgi:hypothetical protein
VQSEGEDVANLGSKGRILSLSIKLCNNGIATKGDSKQDVQQKCGQPIRVQFTGNRDCSEMWLYNFGPNEFMQGVCFDRSTAVEKVLSLTHGY